MDAHKLCPLLIPLNIERTLYSGYIKTSTNQSFQIEIQLQEKNQLKGAVINCEWKLYALLKDCLPLIHKRLEQCTSLKEFLMEFKSLLERQLPRQQVSSMRQRSSYYRSLVEQLQVLGWNRLQYIDADLKEIHVTCEDRNCRKHVLKLTLDTQHPQIAPVVKADIPEQFDVSWSPKSTIADVCQQFESHLECYQELWDVLDEIDDATWVLEPEMPTRTATYRRIALGNTASIQVTVDVKCPRILPECRFLGADRVVQNLRDNLNKNLDLWDPLGSFVRNLRTLLEIDFPSPSTSSKEDLSLECGICYAYRLEGVIPDQVCDDQRCGQSYHHTCLYEWLRAVPTSRQSFNVIFGECPYCNKAITVKMPT